MIVSLSGEMKVKERVFLVFNKKIDYLNYFEMNQGNITEIET